MAEVEIGKVTHYYDHLHVAVLKLQEPIHVGETIHLHGHDTELMQKVESLQIDHHPVEQARPGSDVALLVTEMVHEHDRIYRAAEA